MFTVIFYVMRRFRLSFRPSVLQFACLGGAVALLPALQDTTRPRIVSAPRRASAAEAGDFSSPVPAGDLPSLDRGDGYVTSHACQECHADQHASWHASYHRTMTQVATKESVLGTFDGTTIESDGVHYRVFQRDGGFWAEMPDPDQMMDLVQMRGQKEMARKIPRVERRVIMTTGSHRYQTYWVAGDDRFGRLLQTLPLVYLPKDKRWIPREQAFMRPPGDRFLTQWNHHCIKCHSTGGVPGLIDDGRQGRFETRVAELGIACEACHGPGQRHVALFRESPLLDKSDPLIVNPARLDNKRSSQVCGQCHGVFIVEDEELGMKYARDGVDYKPGDDLHEWRYYIQHPALETTEERNAEFERNKAFFRERWWDDGTILAGGREFTAMSTSGCYLRGEMSCLSCHSMHKSDPEDQLRTDLSESAMCTQCHDESRYNDNVSQHTHHVADSSGSNCLNCHMPNTSYALFSAIRSHQMSAPNVAESIRLGTPNACNLCHLDRTLDWAQQHALDWYGQGLSPTSPEQRQIAAGVLWLLKGDAAQRAITAWAAGWKPARETSGEAWMGLFVGRLLADPYGVVRYIAYDALRKLPDYSTFEFDFLAPQRELENRSSAAIVTWYRGQRQQGEPNSALLIGAKGEIDVKTFDRLYSERNNRPVTIKE